MILAVQGVCLAQVKFQIADCGQMHIPRLCSSAHSLKENQEVQICQLIWQKLMSLKRSGTS